MATNKPIGDSYRTMVTVFYAGLILLVAFGIGFMAGAFLGRL